jgi:class 3 adenylate cyclase
MSETPLVPTPEGRGAAEFPEVAELLAQGFYELGGITPGVDAHAPDGPSGGPPRPVPYAELPEAARERLRQAAVASLRSLASKGYHIEPPAAASRPDSPDDQPAAARARETVEAGSTPTLAVLLELWRGQDPEAWAGSPDVSTRLGQRFLQLGEPLVAYDVAAEALKRTPGHVRLRQMLALALARSGASAQANAVLLSLYEEGSRDEETVGLLARTHKDLATESADAATRDHHLRQAYHYYAMAYRLTSGYWTGINAATVAIMLGRRDEAWALAREVRERCHQHIDQLVKEGGDPYWALATLGEAALILADLTEAQVWYRAAADAGKGRFADLHASRRNARLLLRHLGLVGADIEKCFAIPAVVVFIGLKVDPPGSRAERFPPGREHAIREAIRTRLAEMNAGFGYSSAAAGADILFIEALKERGGEAHIVLPYGKDAFVKENVEVATGGWAARFADLLQRAAEVVTASSQKLKGGRVSYEYANLMLYGLARIRSEQLGADLHTLAVWDGSDDGTDAAAATVARWQRLGHAVDIIDPRSLAPTRLRDIEVALAPPASEAASAEPSGASPSPEHEHGFAPEIRALLFADAVGYSKLTEEEVPLFVRHFLGLVGDLTAIVAAPPILKNTWGDGLYFVFPDVAAAGLFALHLTDRIGSTDWRSKGLRDLNLRIGLHAGPVYSCLDPVTGRPNYIGAQVSRAARIEPITPPGRVYASQPFAALAAAERVTGFRCEYVGQTGLAKNFGTHPTFVVRRTIEAGT